jgi:thiol-disulfide isomerase/thioredoxin
LNRLAAALAVGALAVVALAAALTGCQHETQFVPGPGPSKVKVDTPDLRALKARAGIEDCTPGPGHGKLPGVTLACLGGGTSVDLATLKGPMVLSFWFAGCGPCREEMPALQAFYEHHGKQVPVLGVDFQDQYPGSALETLKHRGVTYPSVADPGGDLMDTDEFAKISHGLPAMFFIDADGGIAYQEFGGLDSEAEVADLVRAHLGVKL